MQFNRSIKRAKGFTLIEAITIIIIVSIISSSFLPRILEVQVFIESTFQKKILTGLIYAQSLAIYSGCHVAVEISNNSFSLKLRNGCQTGNFNTEIKDPNDHKNNYLTTAPLNVTLNSNNFPIYFDHNGQAKLLNNHTITNATVTINGSKLQQTINVTGNNGLIE